MDTAERELRDALKRTGWNIAATARELGVTRQGVYWRMERYGVKASAADRKRTISAIRRAAVLVRHRRNPAA